MVRWSGVGGLRSLVVDGPDLPTFRPSGLPILPTIRSCRLPDMRTPLTAGGRQGRSQGCRRWPTLPRSLDRSTIGAVGLNDRVRDGNGCGPYALIASDRTVGPSDGPTEQKGRKRMGDSREMDRLGAVRRSEARQWVICLETPMGVVKPHGRLGPLRSEWVAPRPRAAY